MKGGLPAHATEARRGASWVRRVDNWERDCMASNFGGGVGVYSPRRKRPVLLIKKRNIGVRKTVTGRIENNRVRFWGGGKEETVAVAMTRGL